MAMDGSDSHGDGHTLAEYFGPDLKEYVLKEQLKWSLYKQNSADMWVFWSEQDHEIEPSLSLDNCADFNLNVCAIPKVTDNIRLALQKFMQSGPLMTMSLFQFWAATTTSEGRTLVTTQNQPFALCRIWIPSERQLLCEYRMKMCSSEYNNRFYADAESGEEQLGLPGRVFLHQFAETTPYVKFYSTKEYPQRDLALRCKIQRSWAVPVFELSSQTCVGVLEMVSLRTWGNADRPTKIFFDGLNKNFQEFGLRFFNGNQDCTLFSEYELWKKAEMVKGLTHGYQELRTALSSVCQFHKLPLAMTWVPCSACDGLRRLDVEFCSRRIDSRAMFLKASKFSHLRKGLVFGGALSSPNMLCCSDISKLSLEEYPLVSYARLCKYRGWFTICLQNVYAENDIYVLEFFLPARSKDSENILTTLSFILGTMEKNFKTFRLASGKELGELTSIGTIDFQNNKKSHVVRSIQATREFSMSSIPSSVQSSASVAYTGPGFQDASMGTINAEYDLNSDSSSDSDHSFEQSTTSVPMVTIKAKYASYTTKFKLSSPYRFAELEQKVTEWLNLPVGTCHVSYEDESGELILIACDEDLRACVETPLSLGNTSIVVFLEPK